MGWFGDWRARVEENRAARARAQWEAAHPVCPTCNVRVNPQTRRRELNRWQATETETYTTPNPHDFDYAVIEARMGTPVDYYPDTRPIVHHIHHLVTRIQYRYWSVCPTCLHIFSTWEKVDTLR